MNIWDKQYLLLQFKIRIYQKSFTEFQSFFEEVMEQKYGSKFKKIRPNWPLGDGGNDGYIPSTGTYFQSYAPKNPTDKDKEAAKKFEADFINLKNSWDKISTIKCYNFVFNDKYTNSSIQLEETRSRLENENPEISFNIFLCKDLEEIFLTLASDQFIALGFDVDSRKSINNIREILKIVETELDTWNIEYASKLLENIRPLLAQHQTDTNLQLDFEIVETRVLQKWEKVDEAEQKYLQIQKKYPEDIRIALYLAEIYLNTERFDENQKTLEEVCKIDSSNWFYWLQLLIRDYKMNNKIDLSDINEQSFPENPKHKSDYYRLYALFLGQSGDFTKAKSFIEIATSLYPEKYLNYDAKISLLEFEYHAENNNQKKLEILEQINSEINNLEIKNKNNKNTVNRNKIYLNVKKFNLYHENQNYSRLIEIAKENVQLSFECYFDQSIDQILTWMIRLFKISEIDFGRLVEYLGSSKKLISDELEKMIFLQLLYHNRLIEDGKTILSRLKKNTMIQLIENIKKNELEELTRKLDEDIFLKVAICENLKWFPNLIIDIIKWFTDDNIRKKLLLYYNYENGNIEEAFSILQNINLTGLNYFEIIPLIEVAEEKKALDFVALLLGKILLIEKNSERIMQFKIKLFKVNCDLEKYKEVISLGKDILENENEFNELTKKSQEMLIYEIANAYLKRGNFADAMSFITKYSQFIQDFGAKISLEAEIFVKNNEPKKAIQAITEWIKILKSPRPQEYASLFLIFAEIWSLMNFTINSQEEVTLNSFIKYVDEDTWWYIWDEEMLDAFKVPSSNYQLLLGKKNGDKIVFENEYRSENTEKTICNILPIEKYICFQSNFFAHKLSLEKAWNAWEMIEVPMTENWIDTKYLIKKFEDLDKGKSEFFEKYCSENIPLSLLAYNEGSLINAIWRILRENRWIIRASIGSKISISEDDKIANKVIEWESFYIDGTSALLLSESWILDKIFKHIPNLKIPQSVINFLLEIKGKFAFSPWTVGHIHYHQWKIGITGLDQDKREQIEKNFDRSISLFESKTNNISVISSANKANVFSEQNIFPELWDAGILAKKEGIHVLTDDFLTLLMQEMETWVKKPTHFSSLALVRVLSQKNLIEYEEYLNYFYYLSSYRYSFLSLQTEDLERAIFWSSKIKTFNVKNLEKFNFPLTLSEEYGVEKTTTSIFMINFLCRLLVDNAIPANLVEEIFKEIVHTVPTKDSKFLGHILIQWCEKIVKLGLYNIPSIWIETKLQMMKKYITTYRNPEKGLLPQ